MNTTTNFNLRKPEPIDFYSVEDQNTNMDKIDETLNSLIASGSAPYSETSTYALGAYCNQLGVMYKCTTAITSPEAWNAGHWTATSVAVELAGKSNTGHTHDDRYYTESETDTLLSGKSDSTHAHTAAQVGADASGTAASAVSTHNSSATAHNSRFDAKANAADLTAHTGNKQNPHEVTKGQVGLDNVPNVATNDQTPTYSQASAIANLTSGEKLSVAFGKIMKAIADFIAHTGNATVHITSAERTAWNAKPTTANVNTAIQNAIGNAIAASY